MQDEQITNPQEPMEISEVETTRVEPIEEVTSPLEFPEGVEPSETPSEPTSEPEHVVPGELEKPEDVEKVDEVSEFQPEKVEESVPNVTESPESVPNPEDDVELTPSVENTPSAEPVSQPWVGGHTIDRPEDN